MARANYVKSARHNIYENGKEREYVSEKGKKKGEKKYVLDRTIPANSKDKIIIKRGESYYWWQFKGSNKTYSKTAPKRSQLTRSSYLSTLYDIADQLENTGHLTDAEEVEGFVDDIKSQIEELKDQCQDSFDNIPEQLQEASSGSLLQERIEQLEAAYDELDGIDCDYEEPSEDNLRDEAEEELIADKPVEEDYEEDDDSYNDDMERWNQNVDKRIEELKEDKMQEWISEKLEEISNVNLE